MKALATAFSFACGVAAALCVVVAAVSLVLMAPPALRPSAASLCLALAAASWAIGAEVGVRRG